MNCLLCGHKLAIFRRLSLGDFCCQEHRSLFLQEQSDQGLARLIESKQVESNQVEPVGMVSRVEECHPAAATRVYAQFLPEELFACCAVADAVGHGPFAQARIVSPSGPQKSFSQLAPARAIRIDQARAGAASPIGFEFTGVRPHLPARLTPVWNGGARTGLSRAGLILPWSSAAGSHTAFSLSPLVAAAWAQSGFSTPMASPVEPLGLVRFAWPGVEGTVDISAPASEMAMAAFAAVEAPPMEPMRVRLSVPPVVHRPKLAMPAPTPLEDIASEVNSRAAALAAPQERKPSLLDSLFAPRPAVIRLRRDVKRREREEVFGYNEPAPIVTSSSAAWRAMFSGLTPTMGMASAAFTLLFVVSAAVILFGSLGLPTRPGAWQLSSLREAIRHRAVLKVEDDFRSGLNRWIGPAGWSKDWSLDQAGFMRPGKLGFLEQSMSLVNYRMEFMGQIERKSLGWVFRAQDDRNYYVAKLTIARPGPLPMVDLIRFPVTNGKEGAKVRVALPFAVRNDTLYQIQMNIVGDRFRASVNGHVVDSWSDNHLRAGGVGFLSAQGESSRVRWVRVSDKDDLIGRVCSYLSARYEPSGDPALSASYFTILRPVMTP